jgi:hypothetical protein
MKPGSVVTVAALAIGLIGWGASAYGQAGAQSLGTIRLSQAVRANGQALPAGTYTLRLTSENASPVVGQAATSARWVEFVQGGQVRGRELATVVAASDIATVGKTKTPPGPGTSRVHALKGGDYVRIWLNSGGTHYLVHLSTAAK